MGEAMISSPVWGVLQPAGRRIMVQPSRDGKSRDHLLHATAANNAV